MFPPLGAVQHLHVNAIKAHRMYDIGQTRALHVSHAFPSHMPAPTLCLSHCYPLWSPPMLLLLLGTDAFVPLSLHHSSYSITLPGHSILFQLLSESCRVSIHASVTCILRLSDVHRQAPPFAPPPLLPSSTWSLMSSPYKHGVSPIVNIIYL